MMKSKSILALLLVCITILLSGCNATPSPDNDGAAAGDVAAGQKGRYIETPVDLADNFYSLYITQLQDSSFVAYSYDLQKKYTSADGLEWQESAGVENLELGSASISSFSMGEDGTIYIVIMNWETYESTVKRIAPDNSITDLVFKDLDAQTANGKAVMINSLSALPDGRLFLQWYATSMSNMMGTSTAEGEEPIEENAADTGEDAAPPADEHASSEEASASSEGESIEQEAFNDDYVSGAGVYDTATGDIVYEMTDSDGLMSSAIREDQLYQYNYDGTLVVKSLADGSEQRRVSLVSAEESAEDSMAMSFSPPILSVSLDGALYLVDQKAIWKLDDNDNKESIMPAESFSFSKTDYSPDKLFILKDGSFLLSLYTYTGTKLFHYHYDENATYDPNKSLTIWTLKDSGSLRNLVVNYTNKHPDSKVTIEIGQGADGAQETDDIIRTLNTKILAGDGPDLIMLDGLPLESYATRGLLADLTDAVDTNAIYPQLLNTLQQENGLFYIPSRYRLLMMLGNESNLSKVSDLQSLVSEITNGPAPAVQTDSEDPFQALPEEKQPFISFDSFEELFDVLWKATSASILKDSQLNSEELRIMLEALKAISDKYSLIQPEGDYAMGSTVVGTGDMDELLTGSIISYWDNRAKTGTIFTGSLMNLRSLEKEDTVYTSFPGTAQGTYQPLCMLGVNAASEQKETAYTFLQEMLADEAQGDLTSGFPVTSSGYNKQNEKMEALLQKVIDENPDLTQEELGISEVFKFDISKFTDSFTQLTITDAFITGVIGDAATEYASGSKSLDETISTIETSVKNYLAERSQ